MERLNFVAFDVETATGDPSSICEIGIAIVENSKVISTKSWLVRPPYNEYYKENIEIHHITPEMTESAPDFKTIWKEVVTYISGKILCAHYATFDLGCLKACLRKYNIENDYIKCYCTWKMAKKGFQTESYKLDYLCEKLGIDSSVAHRADADAKRCAELLLKTLELNEVTLDVFNDCYETLHKTSTSSETRRVDVEDPFLCYRDKKFKDIIPQEGQVNEKNFFYGKYVTVYGDFPYYSRAEIWQKIADIGGVPQQNMTQKTSVVITGGNVDTKVFTKQKELEEKGFKSEIIDIDEFIRRYAETIPDNHFKGKNICIVGPLEIGKERVGRYLCDCGAYIQAHTTTKTDVVIVDNNNNTYKDVQVAERYIEEKGLPIEMLNTNQLLKIMSDEDIKKYGIMAEIEYVVKENRNSNTASSIKPTNTTQNDKAYFPSNNTSNSKNEQQGKSGCLGILLILIAIGAMLL